jgi:hypothetical protein
LLAAKCIATLQLEPKPSGQRNPCIGRPSIEIDATLSALPDPPPFADQGSVAKQGVFDREHIVSRHVLGLVDAIENQKLDVLRLG